MKTAGGGCDPGLFSVHGWWSAGILTSYDSIRTPRLLSKLRSKGLTKFTAHEVSVEATEAKYGRHFDVVCEDLSEGDDLRVLDHSGEPAFKGFSFKDECLAM